MAAVVKRTCKPRWHAARHKASATCVFPVPRLPGAGTFSRRPIHIANRLIR